MTDDVAAPPVAATAEGTARRAAEKAWRQDKSHCSKYLCGRPRADGKTKCQDCLDAVALATQQWKARNSMRERGNGIEELIHELRREDWGLE